MVTALSGVTWAIFWLIIGRNMHNFDFAASGPAHTAAAPYSSPAYYLVLFGQYFTAIVLACGIPGIVAGAGLLQFRPWGRKLAIVASVIDILLLFPLYLLLGVYGLVILFKHDAARQFVET